MTEQKTLPLSLPKKKKEASTYTAHSIEILEGLEPVRKRPGMYIGGTDQHALHHLFSEILDNAIDEVVAGYASEITVQYDENGFLSVEDNGRGIPIDPHPKYPDQSALEIILTTLHSGGKFGSGAYETSGGLHGVGISVVNALSSALEVEVVRDHIPYSQKFSRGFPISSLEKHKKSVKISGTRVSFLPDEEIFSEGILFSPAHLLERIRAKAYLFSGVKIHWECHESHLKEDGLPQKKTICFPNGLKDYIATETAGESCLLPDIFTGKILKIGQHGALEWAITWCDQKPGFFKSYCNTIPTPQGGTHEQAFKAAFLRSIRHYIELTHNKRAQIITLEDVFSSSGAVLSVFLRDPEFQGQTKEKLVSLSALKVIEPVVRDYVDHWLTGNPAQADRLISFLTERAQERLDRKQEKDMGRKTAVRRLRLPGKLSDCTNGKAEGSELFIVEGDSAGGSAKQARARAFQAVLPLRGKILNVAHSPKEKIDLNQQLQDLTIALGCGTGTRYVSDDLRYDRVIIMTDADVDGAHIACLLITFFYRQMPALIREGHLFLAVPPLYRLTQGAKSAYAKTEAHKEELLKTFFSSRQKVEVSRFKGLGEMMPQQLKETTMDPQTRTLLKVEMDQANLEMTSRIVDDLMGAKSETRFALISQKAHLFNPAALDI